MAWRCDAEFICLSLCLVSLCPYVQCTCPCLCIRVYIVSRFIGFYDHCSFLCSIPFLCSFSLICSFLFLSLCWHSCFFILLTDQAKIQITVCQLVQTRVIKMLRRRWSWFHASLKTVSLKKNWKVLSHKLQTGFQKPHGSYRWLSESLLRSVHRFPGSFRKAICSSHSALEQLLPLQQEGSGKSVKSLWQVDGKGVKIRLSWLKYASTELKFTTRTDFYTHYLWLFTL
jgi:hypothetical protein